MGLLTKDIQRLSLRFNAYTSGQSYIVINTHWKNRFALYTNKKLIREGFCSSGSYTMFRQPEIKSDHSKTPTRKILGPWKNNQSRMETTRLVIRWKKVHRYPLQMLIALLNRCYWFFREIMALILGDGYMIHEYL